MGNSRIKRVIAAALLLAFTTPSSLAYTSAVSASITGGAASTMTLDGSVNLTSKNDVITLSLRDSDVKQVLRMFADKAGLNIVFHESVNGKVTLDLVKTPINEAFNLVLQIAGLNYYKQGNTMIVLSKNSSDNAAYSKQEMMVFPVNYVNADKIADFLNKNVFSMKKSGMSGIDAATVNAATNELIVFGMPSDAAIVNKVIEQFDREPNKVSFVVNHTTPAEMANMICEMLLPSYGIGGKSSSSGAGSAQSTQNSSSEEGMMTGGASSADDSSSSSSGSSGSAGAIKLGEGIVACSSSASTTGSMSPFDMQNLSIAYFPQRGVITMIGGSIAQEKMVERFIKENDVKQPQAYLEISIVELNEQGMKEFSNQWGVYTKHWKASFDGTSTNGGHEGPGNLTTNFYPVTRVSDKLDDNGTTIGQNLFPYLVPFTGGAKVSWYMNYLIQNRKGRVLANPKILITNGQESTIDLTQDYVEKVTSEYLTSVSNGGVSSGSVGAVQRTYSIGDDLGIKVSLMPFISPEGYVTLNIKPQYSTVANQIYAQGETGYNDLVATLLSRRDLDLKNVRIKDGETLVLGGLVQENEVKNVNKIPVLGDLPLIGSAFRSTNTTKEKSELVIMITPKIINDGDGTVAGSI